MSGRWVWVPEGWRVVPMDWTDEMLMQLPASLILHEDIHAALNAAPEPPSGWQRGVILPQHPALVWHDKNYFLGWAAPEDWYTPLPPPPDVNP